VKVLVWLLSALNLYFGARSLLNAIHLLHDSKYSQTTTVLLAVLFLGLGAAGLYCSTIRNNPKLGLLIALGPWVLGVVFLLITLLTGNYQ
jgi:hypothetical protein